MEYNPGMATKRIYYDDAFAREFEAELVLSEEVPGSSPQTWRVVLDRTAFYPTSGGQPNDVGMLGESRVMDVLDEDDEIVHVVDRTVAPGRVKGRIDWERRFDHMQQHSGQHLLSAILQEKMGLPTVSFHLGEEICTIDLRGTEPSFATLQKTEDRVNQIVFEDRPVTIRYGTLEELRKLGVRKEVEREGVLRAIEMEGIDLQPCGGTHVNRTGQIGTILLRRCTKVRQDWRLEFLCGERAAVAARGDYQARRAIADQLKCSVEEVASAVGKVLVEREASFKSGRARAERLAKIAAELILRDTPAGADGVRIVAQVMVGEEASHVMQLASELAAQEKTVALLVRKECGHMFFAQHASAGRDMNVLLKKVLEEVGGKGGGTKDFARGGLSDVARAQDALDAAKRGL